MVNRLHTIISISGSLHIVYFVYFASNLWLWPQICGLGLDISASLHILATLLHQCSLIFKNSVTVRLGKLCINHH